MKLILFSIFNIYAFLAIIWADNKNLLNSVNNLHSMKDSVTLIEDTLKIPINLIVNGQVQSGFNIYAVDSVNKAIRQTIRLDTAYLHCSNYSKCYFVIMYGKDYRSKVAISGELVLESKYLYIYYDSRLFNNSVKNRFLDDNYFYIKNHYVIDVGHDNIYIEPKRKLKDIRFQ